MQWQFGAQIDCWEISLSPKCKDAVGYWGAHGPGNIAGSWLPFIANTHCRIDAACLLSPKAQRQGVFLQGIYAGGARVKHFTARAESSSSSHWRWSAVLLDPSLSQSLSKRWCWPGRGARDLPASCGTLCLEVVNALLQSSLPSDEYTLTNSNKVIVCVWCSICAG